MRENAREDGRRLECYPTSNRKLRIAGNYQKLGDRHKKILPVRPREATTFRKQAFGLLGSTTVTEYIPVVLSHPVVICGNLLRQFQHNRILHCLTCTPVTSFEYVYPHHLKSNFLVILHKT